MATATERRRELRDTLWPGSAAKIWDRRTNDGFASIPRLLPLVMHLIKLLSKKGDPSVVYLDLWVRCFDEGIVSINDEEAAAYSSGYSGGRAVRTWAERIQSLEQLGFIAVKSSGSRKIAHVLLINPILVCWELHQNHPAKVPGEWWTAFVSRAMEIGAKLPGNSLRIEGPLAGDPIGSLLTPPKEAPASRS